MMVFPSSFLRYVYPEIRNSFFDSQF